MFYKKIYLLENLVAREGNRKWHRALSPKKTLIIKNRKIAYSLPKCVTKVCVTFDGRKLLRRNYHIIQPRKLSFIVNITLLLDIATGLCSTYRVQYNLIDLLDSSFVSYNQIFMDLSSN